MRDYLNLSNSFNSSCILRNKFYFGVYANAIGINTPQNVALCKDGQVLLLKEKQIVSFNEFLDKISPCCDFFLKGIEGQCGEQVFHLICKNSKFYMGNLLKTKEELLDVLKHGTYILQERFFQNKEISLIYPKSVNTIRIVTVCKNGEIHLLPPVLRIGAMGNEVDNYSRGGVIVEVDLKTGALAKYGKRKQGYGETSDRHPDTGIPYEGIVIPFWKEIVEQAKYFHKMLFNLHSVGWDVAVGENGPVFIEGNDNWEIPLHQMWKGVGTDFDDWFLNAKT